MRKILHIDTNDQIPNLILKSQVENTVKQITDKANGIAFTQSDPAKQPVFNHDGYLESSLTIEKKLGCDASEILPQIASGDFFFKVHFKYVTLGVAGGYIVSSRTGADINFVVDIVSSNQNANFRFKSGGGFKYLYCGKALPNVVHELLVIRQGTRIAGFVDGVFNTILDGIGDLEFPTVDVDPLYVIGSYLPASYWYEGEFRKLQIWKGSHPLDISNLDNLDYESKLLQEEDSSINYYHRYNNDPENIFYLSSPFKKDSDIDSSNNITSLTSAIPDRTTRNQTYVSDFELRAIGADKAKLTKGGLSFEAGITDQYFLYAKTGGQLGVFAGQPDDVWFSFWFRPDADPTAFTYILDLQGVRDIAGGLEWSYLYGWNLQAKKLFCRSADGDYYSTMQFETGTFYHIGLQISDIGVHYFVDGVYDFTQPHPASTTDIVITLALSRANLSQSMTFNDLYCKAFKVIDPTGFNVGDQVFFPPERGGFDDSFELNINSVKKPMVMTVQVEAGDTFTFPQTNSGVVDYVADWGDSTTSHITNANGYSGKAHVYKASGRYDIVIRGVFTIMQAHSIPEDQRNMMIRVSLGHHKLNNFTMLNCRNLESFNFDQADTTDMTSLGNSFYNCNKLQTLSLNNVDLSNVTYTLSAFAGCNVLESLDLSRSGLAGLTQTANMFIGCAVLSDLKLPDPSTMFSQSVNMSGLFYGCKKLVNLNLDGAVGPNCTNLKAMFYVCSDLESVNIDNWDTSNVTDFRELTQSCNELVDFDTLSLDFSSALYLTGLHQGCSKINTNAPELWNTLQSIPHTNAFYLNGARPNNLDIPADWK